jgi:outer membrane protein, heavy metal efflux system
VKLTGFFFILIASSPAYCQVPPVAAADEMPKQLSLEQAEEMLVKRNLAVGAGRYQVEINEAARRIAGLRPNPNLEVGMEQIPFTSNVPGSVPRFFSTNGDAGANPTYTVQFGQLIERGGKRDLRSQQADAVLEGTRAQVLDTLRQQLLLLRQAFSSALLAKANLQLFEDADRQYLETEKLMEFRLRAGDIAGVDLDRVMAARLAFRQAVIDARLAYWQACRDIQSLLNYTQRQVSPAAAQPMPSAYQPPPFDVAGELTDRPVGFSPEELKKIALTERPDLLAAQKTQTAGERGTRLAEALRKRDISLALEYQRVGNDQAVGAVVTFPLFLFNNQKAAISQAVAQERLAAMQVRQAELQVVTDVEKAYLSLSSARQTLDLYSKDAIERATRIREVILYSYHRGEASLLEVLDAQRSANQILASYNQAKAAYQNALWQLQSAVGRSL